MDATYKTCRLMLPLFLLAVKTNVAYTPVCSFIVQSEDTASISEALNRIKQYLAQHNITVANFMIDCAQAEISSIETVFPGKYCNEVVSTLFFFYITFYSIMLYTFAM